MKRTVEIGGKRLEITELFPGGPQVLKFQQHFDERGTFAELFTYSLFKAAGLPTAWAQDNISRSRKDVIRGIHRQQFRPQGKLIICVHGHIIDVAVDLRNGSPSFGKACSVQMMGGAPTAFWIPAGFGHGFRALEDSVVFYKCTTPHDPATDGGINPTQYIREFASELLPPSFTISAKDKGLPSLVDYRRQHG